MPLPGEPYRRSAPQKLLPICSSAERFLPVDHARADVERQAREMPRSLCEVPEDGCLHGPGVGESPRLAAAWIAQELGRVGGGRRDPELGSVRFATPPSPW